MFFPLGHLFAEKVAIQGVIMAYWYLKIYDARENLENLKTKEFLKTEPNNHSEYLLPRLPSGHSPLFKTALHSTFAAAKARRLLAIPKLIPRRHVAHILMGGGGGALRGDISEWYLRARRGARQRSTYVAAVLKSQEAKGRRARNRPDGWRAEEGGQANKKRIKGCDRIYEDGPSVP